jgi:hypothetical protein
MDELERTTQARAARVQAARAALDRRALLQGAVAGAGFFAGAAWLGGAARAAQSVAAGGTPQAAAKRRVVLVAFAGGVRTKETFGKPENIPNLKRIADSGVLYTRARSANLGHYGAALSIFNGVAEQRGIRENSRGDQPTVFELARKELGLPASEAWITTAGGAQQVNYSHSLHPDYGARYGATTLDGDGVFNREFKGLLEKHGRPREWPQGEKDALAALRRSISGGGAEAERRIAASERVEQWILSELGRGTAELTGANAADAKALRLARNLVALFKPTLTAVVLQEADMAHGNYGGYVEVVRRNDAAIGELWTAIQSDPELAATTTLVVVPEFGRDRDLNSRRGLDHGDGSDDLHYVTCLCAGPGLRRGLVVKEEVAVVDVAATTCDLVGAKGRGGRKLPQLRA